MLPLRRRLPLLRRQTQSCGLKSCSWTCCLVSWQEHKFLLVFVTMEMKGLLLCMKTNKKLLYIFTLVFYR